MEVGKPKRKIVLSSEANGLFESYKAARQDGVREYFRSNVKVSQVFGSIAFFYERIRNTLDYKGENLVRRNAIERILRRQIWERGNTNHQAIAESLVRELIWAKYVKNDSVSKRSFKLIEEIAKKYLLIFASLPPVEKKTDTDYKTWFLGVFSCEIEEVLDENVYFKEAMNFAVYSWFKKNYNWTDYDLGEKEKDIQIFMAIHRSLSKSDKAGIRYRILKVYYPKWTEVAGNELRRDLDIIFKLSLKIESEMASPYQVKMYRFVQRNAAAFMVLKEIIDNDTEGDFRIFYNPKKLERKITEVCHKKYDEIRTRVNRGIVRSIVYIFVTKVLLAILIEAPYEIFFRNSINYLPIALNVTLPPLLMFTVGLSIHKPDDDNTKRIINIIESFIYADGREEKIDFTLASRTRRGLIYQIFFVSYFLLFLFTFGGIAVILYDIGFNIVSAGVFFVFLSLVLLFGYRVRYTATELNVKGERDSFLSNLVANIALPLINLGAWLSQGLQKFNFLLMFMDFLIEAPLKNIIRVFEEWTSFIREKREEVIEVPN